MPGECSSSSLASLLLDSGLASLSINVTGLVDVAKEEKKLRARILKAEKGIYKIESRKAKPYYVDRNSEEARAADEAKLQELRRNMVRFEERKRLLKEYEKENASVV